MRTGGWTPDPSPNPTAAAGSAGGDQRRRTEDVQWLRRADRAVRLLAVLDHRQQRATRRQRGAVQHVHVPRPLLRAVAGVEPAGLVVGAVGARGQLAVALLAGQPDLDVVLLGGRRAQVADGDVLHPIVEAERLGDPLLNREDAVV